MADQQMFATGQLHKLIVGIPRPVRLAITAGIFLFAGWFLLTTVGNVLKRWEPLAAGLQPAEQARVLEYLRSSSVEYKFEGSTIMVPADRAAELKINMAGQDLQVGMLRGLERLESVGMGDTEKTIAAKRQLALQEEIEEALNTLPMIAAAKVNLALPSERSFLLKDDSPAKASIWLTFRSGVSLSPDQVRGLQIQISNSIQSLTPDNVSILDHRSNLLSESAEGGHKLLLAQTREEEKIKKAVRDLLVPQVGANRVQVSASVELERDSIQTTERKIDTTNPAETSSETIEEEEPVSTGAGGAPGVESNTGDGVVAAVAGIVSGTKTRTEEKRKIDYPTTITKTQKNPGKIIKKSVAVVIDHRRQVTTDEDGAEQVEYSPWDENTLSAWRQALKDAVGIDETLVSDGGRGDKLSLTQTSFESLHQVEIELKQQEIIMQGRRMYDILDFSDWTALIKIPILLLLGFMILWFVVRPAGKSVLAPLLALPARRTEIPEELPKTVEELEAEIEGKLEEELEVPSKEVTKGTILKKRISELAKSEPENFAQLIRAWMNE